MPARQVEVFNHPCPLVIDQDPRTIPLADDRKIDFYSDGHMVFKPVVSERACESAGALVKVDEESDPYKRLMATIRGCEGATIVTPSSLVGRILARVGLKQPKAECPAALHHVDYSSPRKLTEYFGQGSRCR
ncbi:MAG TPA: hypothetical protein VHB72_04580 [Candidatus Saccharimonadales bacterium]|nr:hypothetical protein [Candidatus Saccharimonadales bacterium]